MASLFDVARWALSRLCAPAILLTGLAIEPACAQTPPQASAEAASKPDEALEQGLDWRIRLAAGLRFSDYEGYVKIPKGGRPGSATPGRPDLNELGIQDLLTYTLAAEVVVEGFGLRLDLGFSEAYGSAVVTKDFMWHARSFEVGEPIYTRLRTDLHRLVVSYDFFVEDRLRITPLLGGALLSFGMNIQGSDSSRRTFDHALVIAGVSADFPITDYFSLGLDSYISLPYTQMPFVAGGELLARVQVMGKRGSTGLAMVVGGGSSYIEFEDSQSFPNHMKLWMVPSFYFGIEVGF